MTMKADYVFLPSRYMNVMVGVKIRANAGKGDIRDICMSLVCPELQVKLS